MKNHKGIFFIFGVVSVCLAVYGAREAIASNEAKESQSRATFSDVQTLSNFGQPLQNAGSISTKANRLFVRLNKDANVKIDVFDLSGNLINGYWNGTLPSGNYSMEPMDGHPLSPQMSVCLIRVSVDSFSDVRRLYPNQKLKEAGFLFRNRQ